MPANTIFCYNCDRPFDHHDMWPSEREAHIKHRAEDRDEYDVFHWICAECEAKFQRAEMQDPTTRAFWMTDEGWNVLLATVRSQISDVKYQKHKTRGQAFRKACAKVETVEGFNIIFYNIYNIIYYIILYYNILCYIIFYYNIL